MLNKKKKEIESLKKIIIEKDSVIQELKDKNNVLRDAANGGRISSQYCVGCKNGIRVKNAYGVYDCLCKFKALCKDFEFNKVD